MLQTIVDRPAERGPASLYDAYLAALRDAVETVDRDDVVAAGGIDADRVDALLAGDDVDLSLSEAAAIVAATGDGFDADAVAAESRDELLMGMTTAVLDVDTVAANVEDVTAKGVQQRLEGRAAMTLEEFARLHAFIASRGR